MDRRRFIELLGMATVGAHIAYSFPSVIVPRNIAPESWGSWVAGQDWAFGSETQTVIRYARAPQGLAFLVSKHDPFWLGSFSELKGYEIIYPFWKDAARPVIIPTKGDWE